MSIPTVKNLFHKHYEQRGFEILSSSPLVHDRLPTAFVMSVGLLQLEPILTAHGTTPEWRDFAMIQRCIRHYDMEDVGAGDRLTFFEMAGAISAGSRSVGETVDALHAFLFDVIGFEQSKVFFTVFGGGTFNDAHCPADEDTPKALADLGIAADHVVQKGVEENLFGAMPREEFCGPSIETFIDRGKGGRIEEHDCGPGCPCGRFVEIGNTVLLKYLKTDGHLQPLSRVYVESAWGVERVALAMSGDKTVYDLEELRVAREALCEKFPSVQDERQANICADHLRAIVFAIVDGARPGHGGRRHVLRKLIRRFLVRLGDPSGDFAAALAQSTLALTTRNGHVMSLDANHIEEVVLVIQHERQIFENGTAVPERYLK